MGGSMISSRLCIQCKGRLFCGLSNCPILEKYNTHRKAVSAIDKTSFTGSSPPSLFVSWTNYPNVSVAPLSPTEILGEASLMDNPEAWFGMPQERIIGMREQLVISKKNFEVSSASNPTAKLADIQELAMASDPVTVDVELLKKPNPKLSFSDFVAPLGPSAPLKNFEITENTSVPAKVDYLVSDVDAKSVTAMDELYKSGIPVHFIYKLLSAGLLGVKKNRRLTPTRWSITAADSAISNILVDKLKGFQEISEYLIYSSSYLDNHYHILILPGAWQFEQLEAWYPGSPWSYEKDTEATVISDSELYRGRKTYADNVTGAYYAARLAVAEHLTEKKRQAGAIIFREIGKDYRIPLGVWQIRENVRNSFRKKPLSFSEINLALKFLETKLSIPMKKYLQESTLLKNMKNQRKITDWMK